MRPPEFLQWSRFRTHVASALAVAWVTWVSNSLVGIQSAVERIEGKLRPAPVASVGKIPLEKSRERASVLAACEQLPAPGRGGYGTSRLGKMAVVRVGNKSFLTGAGHDPLRTRD